MLRNSKQCIPVLGFLHNKGNEVFRKAWYFLIVTKNPANDKAHCYEIANNALLLFLCGKKPSTGMHCLLFQCYFVTMGFVIGGVFGYNQKEKEEVSGFTKNFITSIYTSSTLQIKFFVCMHNAQQYHTIWVFPPFFSPLLLQ